MSSTPTRSYPQGGLSAALLAAARDLLDEGGPPAVGLRETARRVGVSATAAYRHFDSKEALLAALAAEAFRELGAALEREKHGPDALDRMGRAYIAFALSHRGAFRLMFGPMLIERARFPQLKADSEAAFAMLTSAVVSNDRAPPTVGEGDPAVYAAWGVVHGLAHLVIDGVLSDAQGARIIPAIFAASAAKI